MWVMAASMNTCTDQHKRFYISPELVSRELTENNKGQLIWLECLDTGQCVGREAGIVSTVTEHQARELEGASGTCHIRLQSRTIGHSDTRQIGWQRLTILVPLNLRLRKTREGTVKDSHLSSCAILTNTQLLNTRNDWCKEKGRE